jgi:hypothetical protein
VSRTACVGSHSLGAGESLLADKVNLDTFSKEKVAFSAVEKLIFSILGDLGHLR